MPEGSIRLALALSRTGPSADDVEAEGVPGDEGADETELGVCIELEPPMKVFCREGTGGAGA